MNETSIDSLINEIMRQFSPPYPEDITDQVFLKIENNPNWRKRYDRILLEDRGKNINTRVGWLVKDITRLESIDRSYSSRSKLITSYMRLGQHKDKKR